MTAPTRTSAYDPYADEYAAYVATREQDDLEGDPFGILTPPHASPLTTSGVGLFGRRGRSEALRGAERGMRK